MTAYQICERVSIVSLVIMLALWVNKLESKSRTQEQLIILLLSRGYDYQSRLDRLDPPQGSPVWVNMAREKAARERFLRNKAKEELEANYQP